MLVLVACAPSPEASREPPPGDVEVIGPEASDVDPVDPVDPVEALGAAPDPSGALFGTESVHTVDLALSDEAKAALTADPYGWVATVVTWDGSPWDDVAVRLKGHIGSFRTLDEKASFKVDFDQLVDGRTMLGEERLNLHNAINDPTFVHDRVAGDFYRQVGIPYPRVGWARVSVDGVDYGLYEVIEEYDERFLERNFPDPTGNLYDGDYAVLDDGSYPHCDFRPDEVGNFVLDEGADVDLADVEAVTAGLALGIAGVGDTVDLPWLQRYCSAEAWVGQDDGYCGNSNNYRAYLDPAVDGRVRLLPWDHEAAFNGGVTLGWVNGALIVACLDDATCAADELASATAMCADLDVDALVADLDAAVALVRPEALTDPRMEFLPLEVVHAQDALRDWLPARCEALLSP